MTHLHRETHSPEDCLKDIPDVLQERPVVVVFIDANLVREDHGVIVGLRVIHLGKELLLLRYFIFYRDKEII